MNQESFSFSNTFLSEAKREFSEKLNGGTICPCCNRYSKRYKIYLGSGMVSSLIWLFKETFKNNGIWINVAKKAPRHVLESRSIGKLQHWGLVRKMVTMDSSKKNSGYWRITEKGIRFVDKKLKVAKYIYLLNNKCEGMSDEHVDIEEAQGKEFNYEEI